MISDCFYLKNIVPISVYKIRKNATYINEVVIYGEKSSGDDTDVMFPISVEQGTLCQFTV